MINLAYFCDVVCWIPTSAVHWFKWVIHVLKAVAIVTSEQLNLSMIFVVSHFWLLHVIKVSPEWKLNQCKVSRLRKSIPGVPSIEVTN